MKFEYVLIWFVIGLAYTYWAIYLDKFDVDGAHERSREDFLNALGQLEFALGAYGVVLAFFIIAIFAPPFIPIKIVKRSLYFIGIK